MTPKTKRSKLTAGRQFLALLGFGISTIWSGCSTVPASARQRQQLQVEFDATVASASHDFYQATRSAHLRLTHQIKTGFDDVQREFVEQCSDADGFVKRAKTDADVRGEIESSLRIAITHLLQNSINDFISAYVEALDLLEARLLVKTDLRHWPDEVALNYAPVVARYSPEVDLEAVRGSTVLKFADEALGFVPFAGDAWDLYKFIVNDPRGDAIRSRAAGLFRQERDRLQPMFAAIEAALPAEDAVERSCRKAFKIDEALARLDKS